MDKEQIKTIKKLATDGLCRYEICAEMGIEDEECQNLLRYCKLVAISKKQRIEDMIDAGESNHIVAEKLGCTLTYIKQVLQNVAGSNVILVERVVRRSFADTITLPNRTIDGQDFMKLAPNYGLVPVETNQHQTLYELPPTLEKRQALSLHRQSLWSRAIPAVRVLSCYVNNQPEDENWGVELY